MATVGGVSVDASRIVFVLPRIRLSGTRRGQERFSISKANFLPDEPGSWTKVLKLPRPAWLDIYRQFPPPHSDEPGEPACGTLIISDDEKWLKKHISRLIAVAYVLGLDESNWRVPADAFQYSAFEATQKPHDLVTLHTKSGKKTEDLGSLQLLPPLELRGVSTSFRVDIGNEKLAELVRRFDDNPYDRLAVACFHLFRSQFDNPVVAPTEQDFSAYCACLEAALDVTGPDYAKELSDKLTGIYGGYPAIERWIKGLYSERSVFNHGISSEPTLSDPDDRVRALAEFRQKPLSWDILRKLCLNVIEEQLQDSLDSEKPELARLMSPIRTTLRKFFFSEEIWAEIVKVFTQSKSVDTIRAFVGKDYDDFIELCCSYLNGHDWQAMKGKADPKKVFAVLKTMSAIFGEAAKATKMVDDIQSADSLYKAADEENGEAISDWESDHMRWASVQHQNLVSIAKAVAVHTARFFRIRP